MHFLVGPLKCLKKKDEVKNEIGWIRDIVMRNNYQLGVEDMQRWEKAEADVGKKFSGLISYIGWQTRKLMACFSKYDMDITIKRRPTVFGQIKNDTIENVHILQKSRIAGKIILGKQGGNLQVAWQNSENARMMNYVYTTHYDTPPHMTS